MSQPSRDRAPSSGPNGDGSVDPGDTEAAESLLRNGSLNVEGRLVAASNATLYCSIEWEGLSGMCVYKPVAGERPLWDFPDGTLADREVAAYAISQAMDWRIVPPTVHRDGPYGPGMVQLWVEPDAGVDLVELSRSDDPAIRRMAVFDAVINNADRKIGHLLPPGDAHRPGHVYGCDHGVSFSVEYKLRTVLWQWRGKRLLDDAVEALRRLIGQMDAPALGRRLSGLLTDAEVDATRRRIELMLKHRIHPYPPEDWPAVPWPPV